MKNKYRLYFLFNKLSLFLIQSEISHGIKFLKTYTYFNQGGPFRDIRIQISICSRRTNSCNCRCVTKIDPI